MMNYFEYVIYCTRWWKMDIFSEQNTHFKHVPFGNHSTKIIFNNLFHYFFIWTVDKKHSDYLLTVYLSTWCWTIIANDNYFVYITIDIKDNLRWTHCRWGMNDIRQSISALCRVDPIRDQSLMTYGNVFQYGIGGNLGENLPITTQFDIHGIDRDSLMQWNMPCLFLSCCISQKFEGT